MNEKQTSTTSIGTNPSTQIHLATSQDPGVRIEEEEENNNKNDNAATTKKKKKKKKPRESQQVGAKTKQKPSKEASTSSSPQVDPATSTKENKEKNKHKKKSHDKTQEQQHQQLGEEVESQMPSPRRSGTKPSREGEGAAVTPKSPTRKPDDHVMTGQDTQQQEQVRQHQVSIQKGIATTISDAALIALKQERGRLSKEEMPKKKAKKHHKEKNHKDKSEQATTEPPSLAAFLVAQSSNAKLQSLPIGIIVSDDNNDNNNNNTRVAGAKYPQQLPVLVDSNQSASTATPKHCNRKQDHQHPQRESVRQRQHQQKQQLVHLAEVGPCGSDDNVGLHKMTTSPTRKMSKTTVMMTNSADCSDDRGGDLLLSWTEVANTRTSTLLPKVEKLTKTTTIATTKDVVEQNDIVFCAQHLVSEEKQENHYPSLAVSCGVGPDEKVFSTENVETIWFGTPVDRTPTHDKCLVDEIRPENKEPQSPLTVIAARDKWLRMKGQSEKSKKPDDPLNKHRRDHDYPLYDLEEGRGEDTIARQDHVKSVIAARDKWLRMKEQSKKPDDQLHKHHRDHDYPLYNLEEGRGEDTIARQDHVKSSSFGEVGFLEPAWEDGLQIENKVTSQADDPDDAEGQLENGQLSASPTEESPVLSSSSVRPGAYRLGQGGGQERVSSIGDALVEADDFTMPGSAHQQQPSTREDQTHNTIMAEANLVVEPDLVEAKPLRRRRQLMVLVAFVLIAAIVGAVVAGIVVRRVSSSTSPTPIQTFKTPNTEPPSTPAPSQDSVVKAFRASLPNETNTAIDTSSSPQYKAFQWLTLDDEQHSSQLHRMIQRFALATFYYSTNGDRWTSNTGWLNQTLHECLWYGCNCTESKMVNSITLWESEIGGTLPPELSLLSATLETLALSVTVSLEGVNANQLHGSLPTQIGDLTNLECFYLYNAALTGRIPSELARLTKLRELGLAQNQWIQSIPAFFGNLTNLEDLYLWGNALTGSIPSDLHTLLKLSGLDLSENRLTGTIPSFLGDLMDLQVLFLWGNELTGTIPETIGMLTKLTDLELNQNLLAGTIPQRLANLTNLECLFLFENALTGEIPTELSELSKLTELRLYMNRINQSIPSSLGILTNLVYLYLYDNAMTGTIPSVLGGLTNLVGLGLQRNSLTGPIPTELGRLSLLNEFYLHSNVLNQTIPTEFARLSNLVLLYLNENQLTGTIPSGLGQLTNLVEFFVDGNQLSGSMPLEVCDLIEENALNVTTNCNLVNCSCGCSCII